MSYRNTFLYMSLFFILPACSKTEKNDAELLEEAKHLAQSTIIVDTHIDVPYRVFGKNEDISQITKGNFDYPKAIQGGLNTAFMSIYLPAETEAKGTAYALADSLIDLVEGFVETWPDKFEIVESVNAVRSNMGSKKIGLAMGMENGAAIDGNLANLKHYYDRGIRYITLTHAKNNHICDSSYDTTRTWNGLSPFGRKVVEEMNRLGIMIDVSHVSDSTFYQVMRISILRAVFSHPDGNAT
jgi:membrane dipeptidase